MSDVQQPINPLTHPQQFEFFAFVVEGEVASIIPVKTDAELLVAAWSSDPKVIKLTSEQKNVVQNGDLLGADGSFTNPDNPGPGYYTGTGTIEPTE